MSGALHDIIQWVLGWKSSEATGVGGGGEGVGRRIEAVIMIDEIDIEPVEVDRLELEVRAV